MEGKLSPRSIYRVVILTPPGPYKVDPPPCLCHRFSMEVLPNKPANLPVLRDHSLLPSIGTRSSAAVLFTSSRVKTPSLTKPAAWGLRHKSYPHRAYLVAFVLLATRSSCLASSGLDCGNR